MIIQNYLKKILCPWKNQGKAFESMLKTPEGNEITTFLPSIDMLGFSNVFIVYIVCDLTIWEGC